jgi:hypothetical protein
MSEDGYTLAETLVALATIGFAMGGLTAGVRLIGLNQASTNQGLIAGHELRAADQAFSSLLATQGPFASDDVGSLQGAAQGFSFDCGAPRPCAARLSGAPGVITLSVQSPVSATQAQLPDVRQAHFLYVGSRTQGAIWPPGGKDPEVLRAVVLIGENDHGSAPLALATVWREEGVTCVFDPVVGNCRKDGA